jgi:hypothetical protein
MEISKILTLSTAHLHPLEAQKIDKVAYISNDTCSLVNTNQDLYDYYIKEGLPCLVDLLKSVNEQYDDVDYVLFDADANVEDVLRVYQW